MLGFALGALMMALFAGLIGFGTAAGASAGVALIVFYVFLAMFVLSLVGLAAGLRHKAVV